MTKMKTRLLIIIIGIVVAFSITLVVLEYNQKTKSFMEIITVDEKSEPTHVPDPICFIVDRLSLDDVGGSVTLDRCLTLNQFEEMGCTKPILDHLLRHSNLLDYEMDGLVYLEWAGLPSGVSQKEFDECYNAILEKRPIQDSKNQDQTDACPDGQNYNKVLFKCVISCKDGLVYNGYTDSCTTEFELKYHGFCDDGFTYSPSLHVCLGQNSSAQHVPLKDPLRTAPPEPTPTLDSEITYPTFSNGVTEIINHEHSPLKYKTTIPVIDETYLSKNVRQWNDSWRSELDSQHKIHGDEFYTELGRLLMKNEIQYQMNALGIVNADDDFEVYDGRSLTSLPPHIGFSAVVYATDGNYYRLQGGTHANQVSYYKTSQLQFPDTGRELSVESLLSDPQLITIIPEDGHKARQVPSTLVIHIENNVVEFFNNTPDVIRIQDSGSGKIGEEDTLDWIGPTVLPFQNVTMTFDKPGLVEWDARKAPTLEEPFWWSTHAGGNIVVLSDEINDFSRGDKAKIAQKMLHNTDLPITLSGAGNAEQVLMIGIDNAVINTIPDAEEYYLKRAQQLIPFDVEIVMYD